MVEEDDFELSENATICLPERTHRVIPGQDVVERVFKDSANDYITVLGIARRARQILEDYQEYEDLLESETATTLALEEFLDGRFTVAPIPRKTSGSK